MKLLFDQNLPPRLVKTLEDIFPNSLHVREIAFVEATDTEIWNYAKDYDLTIVSKDTNFQQRSLLLGHPAESRPASRRKLPCKNGRRFIAKAFHFDSHIRLRRKQVLSCASVNYFYNRHFV